MGVVSNMPPPYTTGTVSGASGTAVLTGTGTVWSTTDSNGNTVGQVFPGDLVIIPGVPFPNPILSVDSPTQITLEIPLPVALSGSAYRIRRYAPQPQGAVLGALQTVLAQGTDGAPDVARSFDGGTGRGKLRRALGGGIEFAIGPIGSTVDAQLTQAWRVDLNGAFHTKDVHLTRPDGTACIYFGDDTRYLYFNGNFNFTGGGDVLATNGRWFIAGGNLWAQSGTVYLGANLNHYLSCDGSNFSLGGLSQEFFIDARANLFCRDVHATHADSYSGCIYLSKDNAHYIFYDGDGQYYVPNANNGFTIQGPVAATSFVTTSDYRIKQGSVAMADGLALVDRMTVYQGHYADAPNEIREYVLAHELADVLPSAVFGTKDAIKPDGTLQLQTVDYTRLVPVLLRAVQQLSDAVRDLKAAAADPPA